MLTFWCFAHDHVRKQIQLRSEKLLELVFMFSSTKFLLEHFITDKKQKIEIRDEEYLSLIFSDVRVALPCGVESIPR